MRDRNRSVTTVVAETRENSYSHKPGKNDKKHPEEETSVNVIKQKTFQITSTKKSGKV